MKCINSDVLKDYDKSKYYGYFVIIMEEYEFISEWSPETVAVDAVIVLILNS